LSDYFRATFGGRVWKVSVDAGRGCPNRDGTIATGGCIFCNPVSFSPSRRAEPRPVDQQVREAVERLRAQRRAEQFIAYFQPGTNTHGPADELRRDWHAALGVPGVVGLAVGTRPDCLSDDALDLLADIARETWVSVELGLQSTHDRTLDWLRRGHDFAAFADATRRGHRRGLRTVAHLIVGLPGEGSAEVRQTADRLRELAIGGVKLHNLHVVRDTPLAELHTQGQVPLPGLAQYAALAVDLLERLPRACVVERLSGDAPPEYLIAPRWCRDTAAVRQAIEQEFARRGTWQGANLE
jgi:hypothetical protein